jgi:Txe/YoeB family toxin of Txe-Axe toxin-antitoxin module
MKIRWSDEAWQDYQYWRKTGVMIWKMIKALVKHAQGEPYTVRGHY